MLNCILQKYSVKIKRIMYANILMIVVLMVNSCTQNTATESSANQLLLEVAGPVEEDNPYRQIDEIPLPAGYHRIDAADGSFASWLRALPLKKDKRVFTYSGALKQNQAAQYAVIDISVGSRDLQQCADAVMRLRAEYKFKNGKYGEICFWDNERNRWLFTAPYSRKHFDEYLQRVFAHCGSASLEKQLKRKKLEEMTPGDVLIRGGFPGHAVIVMDMAEDATGKKIYLLAQSYMPAQDVHVLLNPLSDATSPWYPLNNAEAIITPEYDFTANQLKTW